MINDGVIGKVLYCHSARNGWEDIQPSVSWKKIRANQEATSTITSMSWTVSSSLWAAAPRK